MQQVQDMTTHLTGDESVRGTAGGEKQHVVWTGRWEMDFGPEGTPKVGLIWQEEVQMYCTHAT